MLPSKARGAASRELVEREGELDGLRALLAAAAGGHGAAALLEGPAGIGKTSLITAARDLAGEMGVETVVARGGELERDFAYGVVRQLFEPRLMRASIDERAALLQGAAGIAAPLLGLDADPVSERYTGALGDDPTAAALHGLYWLTANLAGNAPLLVAVDDLHWCDAASARFLVYLARRVDELPILLLAATRPPAEAHAPQLIEALGADPAVSRMEPAPLSPAAVADLVRAALGAEASDEFCGACHETTAGNPFLLQAVLNDATDAGLEPSSTQVRRLPTLGTRAVARAVGHRLVRLGPAALALARAVAVLGTNADMRTASQLADLDERSAAAAADALVAAQLLAAGRPLEFVHPIVRTAVHEGIPDAERATQHAAAARLLHDLGDAPERVAPHVLAAEPRGEPWVVDLLITAAVHSIDRGAPEAAVRYLRRALAEPPDHGRRGDLLAALGKAEVRAALPDDGVEHLRQALDETPDPRRRAEMAHDLALGLIAPGRYVEAAAMLDDAADAAAGVDPELARRIEAELIAGARLVAETLPLARERLSRLALPIAGDTPGERMLLATIAHQRVLEGTATDAVELAARAVDGGLVAEQSGDSGVVLDAVFALIAGGDLERAERTIEEALDDVRRRGSVIGFARETCMRAMLNLQRGALADAESDARATIDAAWQPGYRIARMAYAPLVDALVEQGRLDEAEQALGAIGLDGEIPDSYMLNFILFARARLHRALGRSEAAAADLQGLAERERKWRADNPGVFPWRSELALTLADDHSTGLAREELALAQRFGTAAAIGRAQRAIGMIAGGDEGLQALRASADTLDGSPWRLEHARSLVELGAALRRSGLRAPAREPLQAGMELAHTCAATPLLSRAREELLATGARPRRIMRTGVEALTPSERRVARMAADGLTNREIAQALFVTMRTVEVHLTHAYQKLDISSRDQLPQALND
jgi:ATP/maltotriose-dependent transcriptional regulator MalT